MKYPFYIQNNATFVIRSQQFHKDVLLAQHHKVHVLVIGIINYTFLILQRKTSIAQIQVTCISASRKILAVCLTPQSEQHVSI